MSITTLRPLANADRLFWSSAAETFTPPPPPDYMSWAIENVRFGDESPFPGPYDAEKFPFHRPILDRLSFEDPSRVCTLMGSAQIGKTVLCQIFIGATLALDPCQALYYHPTESNAIEWARLKWKPFLRGTSALIGVLGTERSRDGSQSLLFYERRDGRGSLTIAGANSGPAVSMKSAKAQVQDDLSKWEMLPSGDSETQADSRSKAFWMAKILKAGTPLLEPGCRITRNFKAGTQEYLHVPCRSCGVMQPLEWENMEATLDPEYPDAAHFTCTACSEPILERDLAWMLTNSTFVANNPKSINPSWSLWAAYSPLESWGNIARSWESAKGIPSAEQVFFNDTVGRAYKAAGESPPYEEIRDRANAHGHKLGIVPWGGLIFTAGLDCQKNRVEAHFKAFGRDGRRWTIEYRVIDGHISESATREALDGLLTETWPDDYGVDRRLDMLAIDGNAWTDDVMGWAKRHSYNRVIVTRGAKGDTALPLIPVKSERKLDGRSKRIQRRFFNLGVSGLKATLYTALAKADPLERGYCGYPKGLDDDFYQQLCAERRVPKRSRDGFTAYQWVKDDKQANEVLDTELIAEGAAIRCGWRAMTDKFADMREAQLVAAGEIERKAKQADLFDPAGEAIAAAAKPAAAETTNDDEDFEGEADANDVRKPAPAAKAAKPAAAAPTKPTGRRRRTTKSPYMG